MNNRQIKSDYPECATCQYWLGHARPYDANNDRVVYDENEKAECTNRSSGWYIHGPIWRGFDHQHCNCWSQRFKRRQ